MALTRNFLKALGIDEDKIGEIVNANSESLAGVIAERDKYKAEAEKLPNVQKQLDEANARLKEADHDGYKAKYEAEKAAHEKLKTDTANEKTRNAKETALREALKAAGYSDAGIKKIAKYGGFIDSVALDESGKLKDGDKLLESVAAEWSEYKGTFKTESANHANPPETVPEKKVSAGAAEAAKIFAELHAAQYGETPQPKKEG